MDHIRKASVVLMVALSKFVEFVFVHSIRTVLFVTAIPNRLRKPLRCPKINDGILLLRARDLASMIRKKEITSQEVVETYISRIKAVNPILNAVVETKYDSAIEKAKDVDAMISTTNLTEEELERDYPLLGLPITIKESIAVKGCSNTSGVVFDEPRKAKIDAPVVKLCIDAGAIPIALTTTPELCINFETYNNLTGVTNNPYDTRRTCGGSTGGEAALLGAGASIIGLGSDLYGSIRIPGHFCGIWGHIPTPGIISIIGHFPNCESSDLWEKIFKMGPMTRYASDLPLLMKVLLKKPLPSLNGKKVDIKDIKFYYMESIGSLLAHEVDKEILSAMRKVIKHLSGNSHYKKIRIDALEKSGELSFFVLLSLMANVHESIDHTKYIRELLLYLTGRSKYTFPAIALMFAKNLTPASISALAAESLIQLEHIKENLCKILGNDGVLIFPTHPTVANIHNQSFGKMDDYAYTGIFNFVGLPVTQCPLGLTSEGLPIGIQIVGGPYNDGLTIAVAEAIEKGFGGWVPPPFA